MKNYRENYDEYKEYYENYISLDDEPCLARECADRIRKEKGLSPNAPVILWLVCSCRRCSIIC